MPVGINIAGQDLQTGSNIVVLAGYDTGDQVTFSKPRKGASEGLLAYDAFSAWPEDDGSGSSTPPPDAGCTWSNEVWIYGNNGGADTLLFSFTPDPVFATEEAAYLALAALMPQTFTGYAVYKVTGVSDPNPLDNRGGLSLLVDVAPQTGAGVSLESVSEAATFAAVTGSWSTDYPVDNLADTFLPSLPARVTPAGGVIAFTAVLAADSEVSVVALLHHTLPYTAHVRVRLYSDAGMTSVVYDSLSLQIPAPVRNYRQNYPEVFTELTARAVRVDIASAGSDPIDLGAVEIGRFWLWRGVSPGADIGFENTNKDQDLVGGAKKPGGGRRPRLFNGQLDRLHMDIAATRGLDFQKIKSGAAPFVVVPNLADRSSWPRGCFQAVNKELPPSVGAVYRHDAWQFRFKELFK